MIGSKDSGGFRLTLVGLSYLIDRSGIHAKIKIKIKERIKDKRLS